MNVMWYWAGGASLLWIAVYVRATYRVSRLRRLGDDEVAEPAVWPTVSVLVPARDEAGSVESALKSLLALDYPQLEVVAIDDRSSDGTGAIIDRLAAEHEALEAVHVRELPDGWLGKTHALQRGLERSSGDSVLLTDADVHFREGALRKAVASAEADELSQLTLMPRMKMPGFWQEVCFDGFLTGVALNVDFDGMEDPDSDSFAGIGAFNLLRRDVLEAHEGFEPLRMEIADDFGIGKLAKAYGGRCRAAMADEYLHLTWYESLGAMIRGMEKNTFAALGHYSYLRVAALLLGWTAVFAGPFLAVAAGGWMSAAGGAALAACATFGLYAAARFERPKTTFLLAPLGIWILMYVLLRSAFLCWRRGGIEWRETRYPLAELREAQTVKR